MAPTHQSLHDHLLDVLLDAADDDHPIRIALGDVPNLPILFATHDDYDYVHDLEWAEQGTGDLKELSDDHKDEVFFLHQIVHNLYKNHGHETTDVLLMMSREDLIWYIKQQLDETKSSSIEPKDDTTLPEGSHESEEDHGPTDSSATPHEGGADDNGKEESQLTSWSMIPRYPRDDQKPEWRDLLRVSRASVRDTTKSLIDRGANGGIAGTDMKLIAYCTPPRYIDVQGIDNHEIPKLQIGSFGAVCRSNAGEVILEFHQYAYHGRHKSIHSCIQLEDNALSVEDRAAHLGGEQHIQTPEGYILPLDIKNGLPYLNIRPFTPNEWETLPHVHMTRDIVWNSARYDSKPSESDEWFEQQDDVTPIHDNFGITGDYSKREATLAEAMTPQAMLLYSATSVLSHSNEHLIASLHKLTDRPVSYEKYRPYFLNMPAERIQLTFGATTQYYRSIASPSRIRDTKKTQYPAANVDRRHEAVATDTIFSDTIAIGGKRCAQIFVGRKSRFIDIFGCKTDKDFVNCLEDVIRKRGAMDMLINDRAQAEISNRVLDILRAYRIKDWQSEPHYQHQNFAERYIQEVKRHTNWVLNWSGAPPETWLLIFHYIAYILNRTALRVLGDRTPYEYLIGHTPDISVLVQFTFWELCIIKDYTSSGGNFPSCQNEITVRFVGFSETVGHSATFMVYNEETKQVLYRSQVKKIDPTSAQAKDSPKPRGSPDDPDIPQVVKACSDDGYSDGYRVATLVPGELIGRSFLMEPDEDGQRFRAEIVQCVEEYEGQLKDEPDRIKFRCKVGDVVLDKLVAYNEMMEFIEEQEMNEDGTWRFRRIVGHRQRKGRQAEVLVLWESGEQTYEPIRNIYAADRYLLAEYARDNDLLDKWDSKSLKLKRAAADSRNLITMVNKAKLKSFHSAPVYMYGYEVPRNHAHAMELDRRNGNTKWRDSEALEIAQVQEYSTFEDLGHKSTSRAPSDFKKISLHFVYAVKHDGRHKSRIVAGGHLTDTPVESVYSGVVSLRGVRIVVFLAEHNDLELWQTDIGNAYLESTTKEQVYVIAGPEFGELEGHVFLIRKALYGLKTSGLRWHERFSDVLHDMGFKPCRAEPDIWMRPAGSQSSDVPPHYEYIAVYVDDLTIASKNPKAITDSLTNKYGFKLKGTGPIKYLLGCDYWPNEQGILCYGPKKYIEKMVQSYVQLFGQQPKQYDSPLERNDHPELDTSDFLNSEDTRIFQSMIGAAQWAIQLGRFDIAVHVMSLSSFRAKPRIGHLARIKRIYGYLSKMRHATIQVRTQLPDTSRLTFMDYDWSKTVYADSKEQLPTDAPPPRGKPVQLITFADANLFHDQASGKAVTGILHFLNRTPFDWFAKKQNTVETATFGSEASAARTACDQIRANKLTLLYLGVPLHGDCILNGDNQSLVNGTTMPHGKLHQRHHMLSFHSVREAIATGAVRYRHISGSINIADILSKHWAKHSIWHMLQPTLFHQFGPTLQVVDSEVGE